MRKSTRSSLHSHRLLLLCWPRTNGASIISGELSSGRGEWPRVVDICAAWLIDDKYPIAERKRQQLRVRRSATLLYAGLFRESDSRFFIHSFWSFFARLLAWLVVIVRVLGCVRVGGGSNVCRAVLDLPSTATHTKLHTTTQPHPSQHTH